MPISHFRALCVALVGIALVTFQPANSETAERQTPDPGEAKQLKAVKKALGSRAVKGDKKPNVQPEDRWYVLLLCEEHRIPYSERHGNTVESGVRVRRSVQYVKVEGMDTAARAVLRFLAGLPSSAGRDFGARYFADEEDANRYYAANIEAAKAAGAKPSKPPDEPATK
jgi:hypothetical protein